MIVVHSHDKVHRRYTTKVKHISSSVRLCEEYLPQLSLVELVNEQPCSNRSIGFPCQITVTVSKAPKG